MHEIVPKIVSVFERGATLNKVFGKVTEPVSFLYLDTVEAEILKTAILNTACLVTVTLNLIFWRDLDVESAVLLDFPGDFEKQLESQRSHELNPLM